MSVSALKRALAHVTNGLLIPVEPSDVVHLAVSENVIITGCANSFPAALVLHQAHPNHKFIKTSGSISCDVGPNMAW